MKFFLLILLVAIGQVVCSSDVCMRAQLHRNEQNDYADPADCHFYYHCNYLDNNETVSTRLKCPDGYFWRDRLLACLPEGTEPCSDRCLEETVHAKNCFAGKGCRQFFQCANRESHALCCPDGTRFNEATCICDHEPNCHDNCIQSDLMTTPHHEETTVTTSSTKEPIRKATFWAPFDLDSQDHSTYGYSVLLEKGAVRETVNYALGNGSLRLNGGSMSIPGLRTFDFGNAASFCTFFKCQGMMCSKRGSLMSNYKSEREFTIKLELQTGNMLHSQLHFWQPVSFRVINSPFKVPPNGWNHVCLTYDGTAVRLHLNGHIADTQYVTGHLAVSPSSFILGRGFAGNFDDILITPFAMTMEEIDAHRNGDIDYLNGRGFGLVVNATTTVVVDGATIASAVYEAVAKDDVEKMVQLWPNMADSKLTQLPIHLAIKANATGVVKFLLSKRPAMLEWKDKSHMTPLHVAAMEGIVDMAKLLVQTYKANLYAKCDFELYEKVLPIHLAALMGHLDVVKFFVEERGDLLMAEDDDDNLPLHYAAIGNHTDVADYLLSQNGEMVDLPNEKHDQTALHLAAQRGHLDIVKMLVEKYNANKTAKDSRGKLAIDLAKKWPMIAEFLMKK